MSRSHYRIAVDPLIEDMSKVKEDAADLAFEHATAVAASSNLSLGSDTFSMMLMDLENNYDHATDHMLYFMHSGLQTLKAAFDTGLIKLHIPVDSLPYTKEDVGDALMELAEVISASLVHVMASGDRLWMTNDEMEALPPSRRAVSFSVAIPPSRMPIQEGSDE